MRKQQERSYPYRPLFRFLAGAPQSCIALNAVTLVFRLFAGETVLHVSRASRAAWRNRFRPEPIRSQELTMQMLNRFAYTTPKIGF
jgi:hypothetical protein